MSDPLQLKGIIIKSEAYSEFDKRLLILTGERGLVTAFVKGARRAKSPMSASTECFVYGIFECYPGRNAYTLARVKVLDYFREITEDITRVSLGYYLLELCGYYATEGSSEKELLNLLYLSVKSLVSSENAAGAAGDEANDMICASEPALIRIIFELRAMVIFGEYPVIDTREVFGQADLEDIPEVVYYDLKESRLTGRTSGKPDVIALGKSTVYTVRYIQYAELKTLFSFRIGEKVFDELKSFLDGYVRLHRHHVFKSEEMLGIVGIK